MVQGAFPKSSMFFFPFSTFYACTVHWYPLGGESHTLQQQVQLHKRAPQPHPDERGGRTFQLYPNHFNSYFTRISTVHDCPRNTVGGNMIVSPEDVWQGISTQRGGAVKDCQVEKEEDSKTKTKQSAGTEMRDLGLVYVSSDPLLG